MNTESENVVQFDRRDRSFTENVFTAPGYEDRYDRFMQVILPTFNVDHVKGAKVFDFGCGSGGMGRRLSKLGADVTFIDGRQSNLDLVKQAKPDARTVLYNVEEPKVPSIGSAQLCLCMGLIYHTGDPLSVLKRLSAFATDIIVETTVLDHDGKALIYLFEETTPSQFSVTGKACRPSPGWVEDALHECGFKKIQDVGAPEMNYPPGEGYPGCLYDWKFERTCGWRRNECALKKMYIATKDSSKSIFQLSAFKN